MPLTRFTLLKKHKSLRLSAFFKLSVSIIRLFDSVLAFNFQDIEHYR